MHGFTIPYGFGIAVIWAAFSIARYFCVNQNLQLFWPIGNRNGRSEYSPMMRNKQVLHSECVKLEVSRRHFSDTKKAMPISIAFS